MIQKYEDEKYSICGNADGVFIPSIGINVSYREKKSYPFVWVFENLYIGDEAKTHTEMVDYINTGIDKDYFLDEIYYYCFSGRVWTTEKLIAFRDELNQSGFPTKQQCKELIQKFKSELKTDISNYVIVFNTYISEDKYTRKQLKVYTIPLKEYINSNLRNLNDIEIAYKKQNNGSTTPLRMRDLYNNFDIKDDNGNYLDTGELGWRLHAYEEKLDNKKHKTKHTSILKIDEFCDIMSVKRKTDAR